MKRIRAALLTPLFLLAFDVGAESTSKPEFTLILPDGWVEVPQDVLTDVNEELRRQAPGSSARYSYAFQPAGAKNWLDYPYVLVQISNIGRPSESQLKALPRIDTNQAFGRTAAELKSFMSNTKLGQMQYDPVARVAWMTSESDVVDVGRVQGLSAVLPTEKGTLQLHGYALEASFPAFLPTFRQIVQSAVLSPSLAYKPRVTDNVPLLNRIDWAGVGEKALAGGIAGAFIGLIAFLARKKRQPD